MSEEQDWVRVVRKRERRLKIFLFAVTCCTVGLLVTWVAYVVAWVAGWGW